MKIFVYVLTFLIAIKSQAQSNEECKYFQVLTFIRTNVDFNNQIKKYININKASKKLKFIDLNVSPWVEFIEIRQFKERVDSESLGLSKEIYSNDRLYYEMYNFQPFKSVFLEKIVERNEAELFLTFSKIFGNSLVVEILNFENRPHITRRIGSGVKILFIFDESGIIKTELFTKVVYN